MMIQNMNEKSKSSKNILNYDSNADTMCLWLSAYNPYI